MKWRFLLTEIDTQGKGYWPIIGIGVYVTQYENFLRDYNVVKYV